MGNEMNEEYTPAEIQEFLELLKRETPFNLEEIVLGGVHRKR